MDETMNPKPLDDAENENVPTDQGKADFEPVASASSETAETPADIVTDPIEVSEKATKDPVEIEEGSVYESTEELDKLEQEYTKEEFDAMSKFYEETLVDFKAGQVVIGKVLSIGEKEVSVDIGFKSEGNVPIEEFDNIDDYKVGDNVEVLIDEVEDVDGFLILSKKKADFMRTWDKVIESYENGDILTGQCVRRIKGGIVVDLGGVDAFLPGSQIDVRPIRDFDALIGKDMDFKIVKVNHLRKNIVVSHRVLVEEEMKGQREKIISDLDRGQVLEGTVKNITDFGVFIDLGGVDGLLHINDLSWGRVSHPSEVVALDEKINVVILDFNEDKNRISLGLKQLQAHPWEDVEQKYPVGTEVRGKVVSLSDYGAFVELEKGVEGLIHISEMSWTQHIKHPSKILAVGEMVEAKVLSIQKDERKISLGLKQLEPDPWESLSERYPIGSRHTGAVRNLTNFGAFVELEEGIDGLIHISDLSWTKKIRHPGEVVKKGDEIEVVVLNVDRDNRRISLGYKQTQDNPWDYFEDKYKKGTQIDGKVVRLIEKGLLAELPDGVDGFVPMSQLAKDNIGKPAEQYQIDDILHLTVIEFNKENKKIVLSEKQQLKFDEKDIKEIQEYVQQKDIDDIDDVTEHKPPETENDLSEIKQVAVESVPESKIVETSEGKEEQTESIDEVEDQKAEEKNQAENEVTENEPDAEDEEKKDDATQTEEQTELQDKKEADE